MEFHRLEKRLLCDPSRWFSPYSVQSCLDQPGSSLQRLLIAHWCMNGRLIPVFPALSNAVRPQRHRHDRTCLRHKQMTCCGPVVLSAEAGESHIGGIERRHSPWLKSGNLLASCEFMEIGSKLTLALGRMPLAVVTQGTGEKRLPNLAVEWSRTK
jgi:hypothetical protein